MVIINRSKSNPETAVLVPLDESTRDSVLDAILAADAKLPANATSSDVATDTKRIAMEHGVRVMQIAGVRSALAKGSYDDMLDFS